MLRRTPVSGETSSLLGWVIIFGVSSVFLTYHISYFIFRNPDELDIAFSWFPPVLLLLTLIFVSRRYRWDSVSGVHILRLSGWFVLGIVILAGSFLAFVVTQSLEGGEIVEPFHAMMGWATGGGVLGIVLGVYDVGHEVQERRALSAERRSHRLERLTEHIMVLNRILRHDIRNSINVIQAHSELIAKKFPESEEHTEVIKGEVRQIVDLSEAASHIEDLVSTEEGEEDDEDSRVELGRIVDEYLDQLQQRYPDTEFENNVPEDCSVEGHKLIPYAVKNVLENAVEHNDKEVPRVEVDLDESSPDGNGGFVTLRIADNGPGLPEEEKRVMEAGEEGQLEHSSGVGLWLVQWIVETSDGDLSVEDREPDGTVVSMSLRRAEG